MPVCCQSGRKYIKNVHTIGCDKWRRREGREWRNTRFSIRKPTRTGGVIHAIGFSVTELRTTHSKQHTNAKTCGVSTSTVRRKHYSYFFMTLVTLCGPHMSCKWMKCTSQCRCGFRLSSQLSSVVLLVFVVCSIHSHTPSFLLFACGYGYIHTWTCHSCSIFNWVLCRAINPRRQSVDNEWNHKHKQTQHLRANASS